MPSCRACWTTRATKPREPDHWACPGRRSTARSTSTGSSPRPADRRAPPAFDEDDRAEFFTELRDALSVAEATRDAGPIETCLREWRTTARALSDPLPRAILAPPGDRYSP